jgi:hypothetical protein
MPAANCRPDSRKGMVMCATTSLTRHPAHSEGAAHWPAVSSTRMAASRARSANVSSRIWSSVTVFVSKVVMPLIRRTRAGLIA